MDLIFPIFLFLFLPIFLLTYFISNQNVRLFILLVASIVFIGAGQTTAVFWLSGIIIVSYALGHLILWGKSHGQPVIWLFLGIAINLILLVAFKFIVAYGGGGMVWLGIPEQWIKPISQVLAPIGLSYVTFQSISYLIDIWRGNIPAEKNMVRFAVYLLFFPKVISGPLMRFKPFSDMLEKSSLSAELLMAGMRRFMLGFIKRTLIAYQLGLVVNAVFNLPTANVEPKFAWLALIAYALQIFLDFSGYTDMALGLGTMIGMRLPENFNYPYVAQSISEFWRRWHMTLTGWFREYVFYPLERHRFRWAGQQINIVLVFLLTGLWHGLKPTFIVWGLMHGVVLALESMGFGHWLKKLWQPLQHLYTLSVILMGWVFFRSSSLVYAFDFFRRLGGDTTRITQLPFSQTSPLPIIEPTFVLALLISVLLCLPLANTWNKLRSNLEARMPRLFFLFQPLEDALLITLFILGFAAVLSSTYAPNIYAKF